jgi:hypothetical protein
MKSRHGVKPAVWGAVAGAIALAVVGFSQLGWTLGSTAEKMATQRAETAVVAALAPICVEGSSSKPMPQQNSSHSTRFPRLGTVAHSSRRAAGLRCLETAHRIQQLRALAQKNSAA